MGLGAPELDAITADAVAGEIGRASKHALPLGTPCPNCTTPLAGAWCHACGQKGEDYHRSIWHLVTEAFEGLTHFDGRFWQTVPRLITRPGRLTRDYLDGHRAVQIPPFRLFLVVLLLVFFAGSLSLGRGDNKVKVVKPNDPAIVAAMSAEDKASLKEAADNLARLKTDKDAGYWVEKGEHAVKNPEALAHAMEQWGHRFAILMLPIAALLLSVLFVFKRGVYVFDHLIFAMHSLSFQGLLLTTIFLGSLINGAFWWLLLLAPVHLFVHMRGTYKISTFGTLVRMWLLFVGSSVAFSFLMLGLVIVAAATLH